MLKGDNVVIAFDDNVEVIVPTFLFNQNAEVAIALGGVVFVGTANGDGLIALRYGVAGDLVLLGGLVDRVLIAAFFFDDGVAKVGVEVRLLPNRTGIHLADE